jgi:hypothetical protein
MRPGDISPGHACELKTTLIKTHLGLDLGIEGRRYESLYEVHGEGWLARFQGQCVTASGAVVDAVPDVADVARRVPIRI